MRIVFKAARQAAKLKVLMNENENLKNYFEVIAFIVALVFSLLNFATENVMIKLLQLFSFLFVMLSVLTGILINYVAKQATGLEPLVLDRLVKMRRDEYYKSLETPPPINCYRFIEQHSDIHTISSVAQKRLRPDERYHHDDPLHWTFLDRLSTYQRWYSSRRDCFLLVNSHALINPIGLSSRLTVEQTDPQEVIGFSCLLPLTQKAGQLFLSGRLSEEEIDDIHIIKDDKIDEVFIYIQNIVALGRTNGELWTKIIMRHILELTSDEQDLVVFSEAMTKSINKILIGRLEFKDTQIKSPIGKNIFCRRIKKGSLNHYRSIYKST